MAMVWRYLKPLWRIDRLYVAGYLRIWLLCAAAGLALIVIGDLTQKTDDFFEYADGDVWPVLSLMGRYYANFAPLMVLRFLFPFLLLVPAVVALTGAAQRNEYVVLRATGISARRALAPLLLPALALALLHAAGRDYYLPDMAVNTARLMARLRDADNNEPIQIAIPDGDLLYSAAIGRMDLDGNGTNFLLEIRHRPLYRGTAGAARPGGGGPDDVRQFIARRVVLRPRGVQVESDPHQYEWGPLDGAQMVDFGQYSRVAEPWNEPIPTLMTPAMFEIHTLGTLVLRRSDLERLELGDPGIAAERYRRDAEPWLAFLVVLAGTAAAMRLALRGRQTSYVPNILAALLTAGLCYLVVTLAGTACESLRLSYAMTAWLPLAPLLPPTFWLWWRLDRAT